VQLTAEVRFGLQNETCAVGACCLQVSRVISGILRDVIHCSENCFDIHEMPCMRPAIVRGEQAKPIRGVISASLVLNARAMRTGPTMNNLNYC